MVPDVPTSVHEWHAVMARTTMIKPAIFNFILSSFIL
jgi:hypothetical protein